ncbi:MAG: ATPase, T2SS/T4P/T4SS family [Pseudomonadota bacterium]
MSRVGDRLVATGVLSGEALARARAVATQSDERLGIVLSRLGLVRDHELRDALADELDLTAVTTEDLPDAPPHLDTLGLRFLTAAGALPLVERPDGLHLAMTDPTDSATLDAIAMRVGLPVVPRPAAAADVEAALDRLTRAAKAEADLTTQHVGSETAADVARLRDLASETPVIQFVNQLIRRAVESRASDIHLEPTTTGLTVRQRIDGALTPVDPPSPDLRAAIVSRIKIMAELNIAEQRLPQDGRIKIVVAGRDIDLRVATLPTLYGEAVVLRLLDRSGLVLDFAGLGLSTASIAAIDPLLARPNGMFLVTGPTGSGKTTTLYAALAQLNRPDTKIITVEDPVEYQIDGITQVQVKPQIGLEFANVIRAILRNNPNIVMIGELRDAETAAVAVQAALTGHLVMATLHTNSASAAINRLRDMGVEDYLITATVIGVMAQRLVRTLCVTCKVPEDPSSVAQILGMPGDGFCAPVGCSACGQTGFRGRTGVHEVMAVDPDIRAATLARADEREIERLAQGAGMIPMREDGIAKAAAGQVALSEVLLAASLQAD